PSVMVQLLKLALDEGIHLWECTIGDTSSRPILVIEDLNHLTRVRPDTARHGRCKIPNSPAVVIGGNVDGSVVLRVIAEPDAALRPHLNDDLHLIVPLCAISGARNRVELAVEAIR